MPAETAALHILQTPRRRDRPPDVPASQFQRPFGLLAAHFRLQHDQCHRHAVSRRRKALVATSELTPAACCRMLTPRAASFELRGVTFTMRFP